MFEKEGGEMCFWPDFWPDGKKFLSIEKNFHFTFFHVHRNFTCPRTIIFASNIHRFALKLNVFAKI
jgi:hypothetical protein